MKTLFFSEILSVPFSCISRQKESDLSLNYKTFWLSFYCFSVSLLNKQDNKLIY